MNSDAAGGGIVVWLQCLSCESSLHDSSDRNLFECSECGYEVTYIEAEQLAADNIDAIQSHFRISNKSKGKSWLCRLLGLFGDKKRLPAPKS